MPRGYDKSATYSFAIMPHVKEKKMKKLFIDSDGTLFQFPSQYTLYDLTKPKFFEKLNPFNNIIEGLKEFHKKHPDVELYIATHILSENAGTEKMKCYKKHNIFSFVDEENILMIPYGTDKDKYVYNHSTHNDSLNNSYLLDDHTSNLLKWEESGGHGIKVYNGMNGNYGRWQGNSIHEDMPAWMICSYLEKELQCEEKY